MMFASVMADFNDRVQEVDLYFKLLKSIDNDEIAVVLGAGPQIVSVGQVPGGWDNMLKGAAYLVLYNLVEAFVNRGFQAVFDSISTDQLRGVELTDLLRKQWIMQRNRRVSAFDGSPKVYMDIAIEIVDEIISKGTAELHRDALGASGNLDADAIRELCQRHGVDHRTSASAHGGSSLNLVKTKRNSLAHGNESFSECGRETSAPDLWSIKEEVVQFVREILQNLQQFAHERRYHVAWR